MDRGTQTLLTPLGEIEILIDNRPVRYTAEEVQLNRTCQDLDGRYQVMIDFIPDGEEHTISCAIKGYTPSKSDGIESGERLACKSFYSRNWKLSIGMEAERWIEELGQDDYDNDYLENGVAYEILPVTKTSQFVFRIAWIKNPNADNDIQTWFGADPTTFPIV